MARFVETNVAVAAVVAVPTDGVAPLAAIVDGYELLGRVFVTNSALKRLRS